jgi:hypothetical protein
MAFAKATAPQTPFLSMFKTNLLRDFRPETDKVPKLMFTVLNGGKDHGSKLSSPSSSSSLTSNHRRPSNLIFMKFTSKFAELLRRPLPVPRVASLLSKEEPMALSSMLMITSTSASSC